MKHRILVLLVGVLAFVPQIASANAGTPLMWAGLLHLVVGNALIGFGEGIKIISPNNMVRQIKRKIKLMNELYSGGE